MTKIKIEIHEGGDKTSIIVERSRYSEAEKKAIEFLRANAHGDIPTGTSIQSARFKPEFIPEWLMDLDPEALTQKEKVRLLLQNNHPSEWIRSQDLKREYQEVYGEDVKLSSLSTYLARFYWDGSLERKGTRAQREYRLPEGASAAAL